MAVHRASVSPHAGPHDSSTSPGCRPSSACFRPPVRPPPRTRSPPPEWLACLRSGWTELLPATSTARAAHPHSEYRAAHRRSVRLPHSPDRSAAADGSNPDRWEESVHSGNRPASARNLQESIGALPPADARPIGHRPACVKNSTSHRAVRSNRPSSRRAPINCTPRGRPLASSSGNVTHGVPR